MATPKPTQEEGSASKTADLDAPLGAIGFQIEVVSASLVSGRFTVSPICCQVG